MYDLCTLCQVLPTLVTLYRVSENSSSHLYMSLIVLLILTEDPLFNRSVHDTVRVWNAVDQRAALGQHTNFS